MENFDCNQYKALIQNIGSLFQDENRKDVTFVFKESDEKIKAHKCILEAASPVFKVMFSGNFTETDEVKIDDIRPEVFKLFLSAIYLNDIHSQVESTELPPETYADLYYTAEKYDIKDIREISKKSMFDHCHYGVTHLLLKRAKLLNLPDLEATCKDYYQKQTYYVLASHISFSLDDDIFHEFFDLDNLAVKSEFDLYMALQAIVDNENLLDYSKCLSKIRFLTMDTIEILSCNLLSAEDKVAVISNIEAKKFRKTPKFPMPAHLSTENGPRQFLSSLNQYKREYFWTAMILNCAKYEDYFEDYCEQMEISTDSKERTKAIINEGRIEVNKDGLNSPDVISEITKNIFSYE